MNKHFSWPLQKGISLHLNFFANINLVVIRDSRPSGPLRSSRKFIVRRILYRRLLLLLLMIDNRFLENRFQMFINFCHRRTNNRCCSHGYRRICNGLCNHIALHHGCNSSRYREKWFCDHRSGHTDPLLLKSYLLRYHAPPDHFIL
jgi:hypothetical protein